ncbi:bifunctional protein-serine/threonine kinase/phosphatase [Pseudoalteromonas denitrificans]|uniref:Protein phosphatase n=1 Tax=Pseudoalteromonas denitrificans DSM 6059 TaxID=1123010 RepID=A0A1I1TSJ7_9GAMM|nr:bifunctional protein-serine/threonine kinase/phosphatase [Pseudoalteromonas denitrificans]SFD59433.1 protein phosphatase [Pseudoalteromonas denitrificans DSM 6059]
MQKIVNQDSSFKLAIGGYSTQGKKAHNQDAFAALMPKSSILRNKGACAVIADGLSCADNAAQAAQLSVTQFIESYYETPDTWSVQKSSAQVFKSLNSWLYGQAKSNQSSQWLTTLSAIICKSSTAHILHVGDCRIARLHNNALETLTREHNHSAGGSKTVLTRAMGADHRIEVDYKKIAMLAGDIYMLSSDGVFNHLTNKMVKFELAKISKHHTQKDLEKISKTIINKAIEAGSEENLTCLIVKIEHTTTESHQELDYYLEGKVIPPPLKVGDKIDNFQVLQIIQHSTRSHIYLVKDNTIAGQFILKIPSLNYTDDQHYLRSFIQEAWIGERTNHVNLVNVYFATNKSKFLYHLSDHIVGQSLRQWMLQNVKPEIYKVQNILKQLILAARTLQRMEIIHRDIRPENILIDENDHITLIDYGAAHVTSFHDGIGMKLDHPMGTLEYSAPEYLIDHRADFKSDMFSISVLMYELLSGQFPYKTIKHQNDINHNLSKWQYKSIRSYRIDCPVWIDLALRQACAADHKNRYQAFSEFETDMCSHIVEKSGQEKALPYMERDPVKFWQIISLCLFIALLIVAFK